jgi:hypothetical protein
MKNKRSDYLTLETTSEIGPVVHSQSGTRKAVRLISVVISDNEGISQSVSDSLVQVGSGFKSR